MYVMPLAQVEVRLAEIVVRVVVHEQVVDDGENGMRHRNDGFLATEACAQASELGGEIGVGPRRGLRGLDQCRAHPAISLAGLAAAAFAGAFVLAWAQSGPRDQMSSGWEALYVWTDFGHDDFGGAAADARDRVQVVQCDLKSRSRSANLGAESVDRLVQEVDVR